MTGTDPGTASKPQLYRTESRQSAAASDDYYSFSEKEASSPDSQVTAMRFATPDSQPSSQASSPTVPSGQQPQTVAETQPANARQPDLQDLGSPRPGTSSTVRFGEDKVARISPKSNETVRRVPSDYAGPAPTPGLDDSPYVRFAIDQLTRDEQVHGPRRQDSISTRDSDQPTERLLWDEGLGYFTDRKSTR